MKKHLKGFIIGVVVIVILFSSVAMAASLEKTIKVVFNSVNLEVNGKIVEVDNILYNGTTYVPLRAVAEMLGKEVGWNQATRTVSINDKAVEVGKVTIDQIPLDIKILKPDSIGNVYMEATYKNNTGLPILSYSATILLKDKNEKTYLSSYDTVLPGETSPKFSTFGPSTQNKSDIEILETEIRLDLGNGKYLVVEYDHKLKRYTYNEYKHR